MTCIKAAYGLALTKPEHKLFSSVAGARQPPTKRVKEFIAAVSRRGGKGRVAGALACYESALVDHSKHLAPGEVGVVACISPTRAQAQIIKDYTLGYFTASPILRDEVQDETADEIRLRNGNVITTLASDYRTLRGRTLLLAIVDEAAFLRSEESSVPDIEAARALLPGLNTTGGMLCILSSPYRQAGLLFQRHRDFYGKDSDSTLVVAGQSTLFNPTLDASAIEAAIASDPEAAQAEWLGQWRRDLQTFLPDDLIDSAIDRARPLELPPQDGIAYKCFTDMSGGAHDAATICIAHKHDDHVIVNVVQGVRAPFDPATIARQFADLAKQYRCRVITGDNYSAGWVKGAFEACGIEYKQSPLTRSELYLEGLPLFARGQVRLPDHPVMLREMRLLQRRSARSGKDSVDHGPGGHDDHVNSVFGSLYLVTKVPREVIGELMGPGAKIFNADGQINAPPPVPTQPPPALPSAITGVKLDEAAQERLEHFKADYLARQSRVQFYGKCFGAS